METLPALTGIDWAVIIIFFVITLGIGLSFSKKATGSMVEYFVAGRKMTWWVAGTSIVATSFAADTPLVISGWIRTVGLERNWFWWGGIMGMMLCTFFFARLWRRSKLITDVEFNELRYGGKPAACLRFFHASYRSLIQNTLVMGWVTLAMAKIIDVTLDMPTIVFLKGQLLPELVSKGVDVFSLFSATQIAQFPILGEAIIPAKATGIVLCLFVAAFYSAISGLWGVMATDFFQFSFAMFGTILLMVIVFVEAKGPKAMVAKARQAVMSGKIVNKKSFLRKYVKRKELGSSNNAIKKILATGLVSEHSEEETLTWTAHKMTENTIQEKIDKAGFSKDAQEKIVEHWKKGYTILRSSFTGHKIVEKILASDILLLDRDASGKEKEYYRIPDVSISDAELSQKLEEAGVEDKSEILAAWHYDRVVSVKKITSFLPPFDLKDGGLLAVWSFVVFMGLQWWAGGEGGGFLAQRLFSCKDEKHSLLAMLWYNVANFALRPWPWIVVGVASLFLIPDVTVYGEHYDQEHAYAIMLMKYLPTGLKGMMVASLMAAYMSTISTHVNFGASYIINDIYKRFISPESPEKTTIFISQIVSILLAVIAGLYAYFAESIATGWFTLLEIMSGTGFVVLLRWYWWRISAWSELSAMCSSIGMFLILKYTQVFQGLFSMIGAPLYLLDDYAVRFSLNLFITTTIWLTVTFLMPPERTESLLRFYKRVQPAGWWEDIAKQAGNPRHATVGSLEWRCWGLGVTGLFSMIFCLGKACFGLYGQSLAFATYSFVAGFIMFRLVSQMDWSAIDTESDSAEEST